MRSFINAHPKVFLFPVVTITLPLYLLCITLRVLLTVLLAIWHSAVFEKDIFIEYLAGMYLAWIGKKAVL